MSDTEVFFYAVQKHLGGTVKWEDLNMQEQMLFIQAINIIKSCCEKGKS